MQNPSKADPTAELLFAARTRKAAPRGAGAKGRGVFALAGITAGEVVDAACTVELDSDQCATIENTPLGQHYFMHPADETLGVMVLGLPSLCNHAEDANTETRYVHDEALGWIVYLTANRDIAAGAEITRRYACPPWFEAAG